MSNLIIDGNSLGYAGQHMKPLSVDGQAVQSVFYFLKTLKKVTESYPEYKNTYVLWDKKAQFRFDLYPEYKGQRSDTAEKRAVKEEYQSQVPIIQKALNTLGVPQLSSEGFEADDLAGFLSRKTTAKSIKSLLITGDEDWCQLVNQHTSWHDPRNKGVKFCDHKSFKDFSGVKTTSQFLQVKALEGDSSDNITGVNGIGEKSAKLIMEEFGGIKGLVEHFIRSGKHFEKENLPKSLSRFTKKINEFLKDDFKTFARNIRLMDLIRADRDEEIQSRLKVDKGCANLDDFVDFCADYGFASIMRQRSDWANTFKLGKK